MYLVLYVVGRNICTPSALFMCKIFPTYNKIISMFNFMTSTDMFYARHLNTSVCAIEYNLLADHYIIEVYRIIEYFGLEGNFEGHLVQTTLQ